MTNIRYAHPPCFFSTMLPRRTSSPPPPPPGSPVDCVPWGNGRLKLIDWFCSIRSRETLRFVCVKTNWWCSLRCLCRLWPKRHGHCLWWICCLDQCALALYELVTLIALHLVHPAQAINLAPEVLSHSNIHNLNKAFYLIICTVDIVIQVKGILVWTSSGIPVNNL